ncbi:MAG: hypothetical protein AAF934_06435 [Bacteroidota bacterium]
MGARIRDNTYSNVINPVEEENPFEGDMIDLEYYQENEGVKFGLNFALGLKLYYRIGLYKKYTTY